MKGPLSIPPRPVTGGSYKGLPSRVLCNRPNGQDDLLRVSCSPNVLVVLLFENNATLFCNSNLSFSARKEVGLERSTTPLIGTPVFGSVFPRITSFLMMDSLAYWNHALNGGRHYSGTSFKPGAPLHSACLGSPELYRRSEGVGWRVKTFTLSQLTFTDSRLERSGENENITEPPTTSPARIKSYRCIFYKDLCLYNRRTSGKLIYFRNLSRNLR